MITEQSATKLVLLILVISGGTAQDDYNVGATDVTVSTVSSERSSAVISTSEITTTDGTAATDSMDDWNSISTGEYQVKRNFE